MKYDLVVYIGRFSPVHKAHLNVMGAALKAGHNVLVLTGSSFRPRTIKNPWNHHERSAMIKAAVKQEFGDASLRLDCKPLRDFPYSDTAWATDVQTQVEQHLSTLSQLGEPCQTVAIIGCAKDESSYYLGLFPQWGFIDVNVLQNGLSATQLRKAYFEQEPGTEVELAAALPPVVLAYLDRFSRGAEFAKLKTEFEFEQGHKAMWASAPFPPTFNTVDAVVMCAGHVLLVKRRNAPGKGLWALPGGYVGQSERLVDACLRELREETRLRMPEPVLKGSLIEEKTFDNPSRSLRGRIITQAFFFQLAAQALPKVRGSDDAERAQWVPLSKIREMSEQMFEDHFDMLRYFEGKAQ